MELRNNCSDPLLDGKVIVLSATEKEFQTIKRISKAPSKSAKEYASPITSENNDANDSISSELERLSKLKDSGAISEEEFSAAKAKLLGL